MRILTVLCLAVSLAVPSVFAQSGKLTPYETMRDTLLKLTVDTASHRLVEGLVFEDGLITVSLDSGSVAYLERYDGRRIGMVFKGKGTVIFTPVHLTEVVNLKRFTGKEQFMEEFEHGVFAFADNRLPSLVDEIPATGNAPRDIVRMAASYQELLQENDGREVDGSMARCLLNGYELPLFAGQVWRKKDMMAYVIHDPFDYEPFRLVAKRENGGPSSLTTINQCPEPTGWPVLSDDGVNPSDLISVAKHTMTCTIDRSLDMTAKDVMDVTVRKDGVKCISLDVTPLQRVSKVRLNGDSLAFFQAKDGSRIWVHLPTSHKTGDRFSLEVSFGGEIIERYGDYTVLRTSIDWYPTASFFQKSLYDITFSYPSSMTLLGLGKQDTIYTVDRTTTSRWITSLANTNNAFHVGLFKKRVLETDPEVPTATLYYRTPDQVDAVSDDIRQSLLFFTRLFGQLDVRHLNATELPGSHGEAFPGLLHLSTYAFYRSSDARTDDFFSEQFTSHEVAHQWWGISVKPKTYRDRWISEGFAMYACLLYSQLAAKEQDKFFRLLDEYRTEIMDFGKKAIGKDLPPPPVDLGHRVTDGAGMIGGAYNAFVYYKGAWVLHMLRNMMLDLKTMKEDAFMTVMREFYTRYSNKRASTEDFRQVIQDVTGQDLGWYFDQWVYGNEQPTYTVGWKKEPIPGGQWKVSLRVRQSGVSDNFLMVVPVKVADKDGRFVRLRIKVTGADSVIELPHVGFEPADVVFNDLSSVLCNVKTASF